ncbi:Asp23/Gls24 family protein [Arthrobacter livingstonensis]|uniref:Asp23/Gls24 family protein n=1 Tax=Arthrobacter livingstonensis TaxID=670078 RepID=A0A2V5LG02_9MICC|nr:Asp23/Gls24 family envelope stress response protein [Arthrobacter livingstonensis]PYI69774.1 Asp23/Gls24 family protein [Arthrobacter livingstonensis]
MNAPGAPAQARNAQASHATPFPGVTDAGEGGTTTRGQTVLEDKVIEKIASQVARDETLAGGSSGGFLGIGTHADRHARPKVSVELTGNIATLSVEVGMPYPIPLRQATEELRQRIRVRVMELTGVEVRHVDIRVSWLIAAGGDAGGRRRLL